MIILQGFTMLNLTKLAKLPTGLDLLVNAFNNVNHNIGSVSICMDDRRTTGTGVLFGEPFKDDKNNDILFGHIYYLNSPVIRDKGYCIPISYIRFPYQEEHEVPGDISYLFYDDKSHSFTSKSLSGYAGRLFKPSEFNIKSDLFLDLICKES